MPAPAVLALYLRRATLAPLRCLCVAVSPPHALGGGHRASPCLLSQRQKSARRGWERVDPGTPALWQGHRSRPTLERVTGRCGDRAEVTAILNNLLVGVVRRYGWHNLAEAQYYYAANLAAALRLLLCHPA